MDMEEVKIKTETRTDGDFDPEPCTLKKSEVFALPHLIHVDSARTPCSLWTVHRLYKDQGLVDVLLDRPFPSALSHLG
jgi:hypothetical protein